MEHLLATFLLPLTAKLVEWYIERAWEARKGAAPNNCISCDDGVSKLSRLHMCECCQRGHDEIFHAPRY